MTTLERCLDFLDRSGVWYAHTRHPLAFTAVGVAFAENLSPHKLAKTVVYVGAQGYGFAVLPADSLVDMQQLGAFLNDPALRIASEQELGQIFPECELGAMPPLGILFHLPVIVDTSIAEQEFIAFNAGTHLDVIHMSFGDYDNVVDPAVGKFAFTAVEQRVS
jgi:Ala-tRNA(Pro) deacylase